jgi:arylsulfatase A-like enzyme
MIRFLTILACLLPLGHAAEKPNVLLIAIDDLNDWVGCLGGHPQAKTPHIDALARQGTLFTNAHCQAPICLASRTSLMTGRRNTSTGIYGLAPWFRNVPDLKEVTTLPQAFKKSGYQTAITGKIYHSYPPQQDRATEFDLYGPRANFGPFPEKKLVDTPSSMKLVDWGVFPEKDEQQGDWTNASWGAEFLTKHANDEKPFFLAVGFGRPHVPCFASQHWFDLYPEDSLQLPPLKANDRADTPLASWRLHWNLPEPRLAWLKKNKQTEHLTRSYLASVSFVDSQVGRVTAALRESGLDKNTIVILWSDHGFHLGEKEITGKNTLWEESTRVPLIIAGPGIPQGQSSPQPAELLDIYPTLLDLCKLPTIPGLEGISLRPQINDPDSARRPAVTSHNPGNHAVRSLHHRYIRYADGSEELYDHRTDPNEWNNLIGTDTAAPIVADLAAHLPDSSRPPVKGSRGRILVQDGDTWLWEGKDIRSLPQSE